jgi:hypothetical protein
LREFRHMTENMKEYLKGETGTKKFVKDRMTSMMINTGIVYAKKPHIAKVNIATQLKKKVEQNQRKEQMTRRS